MVAGSCSFGWSGNILCFVYTSINKRKRWICLRGVASPSGYQCMELDNEHTDVNISLSFLLNHYYSYLGINLSCCLLFGVHTDILLRRERKKIQAAKKPIDSPWTFVFVEVPSFLALVKELFPCQSSLLFSWLHPCSHFFYQFVHSLQVYWRWRHRAATQLVY